MMERYPIYKDSGADYLGKIPSHWDVVRSRFIFDVISGNGFSDEFQGKQDGDLPFYKCSDINSQAVYAEQANNYVTFTDVKTNRWSIIPLNSILLAKIGEALKKNHRKINKSECLVDNNMMALVLKDGSEMHIKYYYYLMCLIRMEWFVNPGAVPSVDVSKFRSFVLPRLKKDEQVHIITFVDRKTAQIDDLITKKKRMIELLKEERTAVINQAVTKGLDPEAEMKDSGIDWLGKIPKHWGLKRLKYLVKLINEKGAINDNSIRVDLENIESWTGQLIKTDTITATDEEMKQFIPGDVLFNKLRPYLAKVFHARQEGICGGELLVLRHSVQIDSKFLYYRAISNDFIRVIDGSTYGTKMPRASWDFIGNLFIPYPSIEEQRRIVDFFDRKTAQIDAQVAREQRSIDLLKEYRTSLISEIVTGKICVLNQDCGANNAA